MLSFTSCFPKAGAAPGPLTALQTETALARLSGSSPESLEQGRQLFLAQCNGCHDYPDLQAVEAEAWPRIAKRMGKKSDLSPADSELVLLFIQAAR